MTLTIRTPACSEYATTEETKVAQSKNLTNFIIGSFISFNFNCHCLDILYPSSRKISTPILT